MSETSTEPEHIGRWRVLRTIARGGMATVYAVADPDSGERFAIKLLTQQGASVPRLLQEYRALARIDHPNIVRVFQFGATDAGQPFVVMELLDGVPAQVRVKATGRPGEPARTAEAARIAMDVAAALGHLHARGIVHRDLKSSNVLVLHDGTTRLLDFGTARLLDAYEPITQLGEFVGTFAYASPEQLTGGAVDARSDLYSLGVLLFRMLCGRRPFEGENPQELARNHLDTVPPDPGALVPALPRPLSEITLQLLAKLPADRPADARTVAEALSPFASESAMRRGIGAAPILGRDRAFAEAQRFLTEAGSGSTMFAVGEEGSGRRTLVELVAEEANRQGFRTISVAGGEESFRRFMWAIRDLKSEAEGPEVDPVRKPSAAQLEAVAETLAARAKQERRRALLVAPAFWTVPEAQQQCFVQLMQACARREAPVALLAAVGPQFPVSPLDRSVELRALSGAEVSAIAAHWLNVSSIPPELARRLVRASGGLPGPLTELVRALPSAHGHTPLVIPPRLREEALLKLAPLAPLQLRLMEAVALAERELDTVRLAWLVDADRARVSQELDALARAGLLSMVGAFWTIRQGLVAELVRSSTHPARRHLFCRRLADVAADLPASEALAEAVRVAGRDVEAAEIAVRWAWPVVRAGAYAEVLPLLERLARQNPLLESGTGVRFWTLYGECLAELQLSANEAALAIGRAAALASDPAESAEVELAASRLARARSDPQAERSLLQTALSRLDGGPSDGREAEGRAHLADLLVRAGDFTSAVSEAGLALRSGASDLVRYATTLGYTQLAAGHLGEAELTFRTADARARADGRSAWRALAGLVIVLTGQGRYSEAGEIGDTAERAGRAGAPAQPLAALELALAELDVARCRSGVARNRLDRALDVLHGEVPARLEARVALLQARLAWEVGDSAVAVRFAEEALKSPGVEVARGGAAEVRGVRGVYLCGSGRPDVGWVDLAAAITALVEMGALPALARLAELATVVIDDPSLVEPLWMPLGEWMDIEAARPARLARAVNRVRFVRARGWNDDEECALLRQVWDDLVNQQTPADATGLHVHRWARLVGVSPPAGVPVPTS